MGKTVDMHKYESYINDVVRSWARAQAFLDGDNYRFHTMMNLSTAIVTEIGELAQALKPDWAWWSRKDKKFKYGDVAGEVADIMHFTLAGLNLMRAPGNGSDMAFDVFLQRFVRDVLIGVTVVGNYEAPGKTTVALVPLGSFPQRDLLEQIASPRYNTVEWGLRVVFSYGDPIDLNKLYYDKAEENLRRWGRDSDIHTLRDFRNRSERVIIEGVDRYTTPPV